jgi:hypothetical protein
VDELNNIRKPNVIIDDSLDKYKDLCLFPEKVDKANQMLRTTGLPKTNKKKTRRA